MNNALSLDISIHFFSQCTSWTISDKRTHALPKPPIELVPLHANLGRLVIDIISELDGVPNQAGYINFLLDLHSKLNEVTSVTTFPKQADITFLSNMFGRWQYITEAVLIADYLVAMNRRCSFI